MKKWFASIMAAVSVFSCCVFTAAAEQNYCSVFENGITFLSMWQSGNVAPGEKFEDDAMIRFTVFNMETADYASGESGLELTIPGDVFETELMKHFDVDVAYIRSMQWNDRPIYDGKNYCVEEFAGGGNTERYKIRGYKKQGEQYIAYYTLTDTTYQKPAGAVEGKDYLLDYSSDPNGVPIGILDKQLQVTLTYNGGNVKFLTWEHINALPDLSGMTTPTKPDVTVGGTTILSSQTTTSSSDVTTDPSNDDTDGSTVGTGTSTGSGKTNMPTGSTVTTRTTIKDGRVTTAGNGTTVVRTTIPTVPLETVIATDTVTLLAAAGTFPKNVVVNIQPVTTGDSFNTVKKALNHIADKFIAYELTATSDTVAVQPNGRVTATFAIPDGYEANRTAVVYIAPNGVAEILVSKVDTAAGTVTAELSHFSTYAVAQLYTANAADGPDVLLIILLVVGAALLLGGAGMYIRYRKKNALAEEQPLTEE